MSREDAVKWSVGNSYRHITGREPSQCSCETQIYGCSSSKDTTNVRICCFSLFYLSKLNIFRFWTAGQTKPAIWRCCLCSGKLWKTFLATLAPTIEWIAMKFRSDIHDAQRDETLMTLEDVTFGYGDVKCNLQIIVSGSLSSEVNCFSTLCYFAGCASLVTDTQARTEWETPLSLKALMFLCQNPSFRSTH